MQNEENVSYLFFKCNDSLYAIESNYVREITRNAAIYPLPFVPKYIKGVLNNYGQPFAVVDIALLMEEASLQSKLFMILNDDSCTALQISDILEFGSLEAKELHKISDDDDLNLFIGTVDFQGKEAPVLNIASLLQRVQNDVRES